MRADDVDPRRKGGYSETRESTLTSEGSSGVEAKPKRTGGVTGCSSPSSAPSNRALTDLIRCRSMAEYDSRRPPRVILGHGPAPDQVRQRPVRRRRTRRAATGDPPGALRIRLHPGGTLAGQGALPRLRVAPFPARINIVSAPAIVHSRRTSHITWVLEPRPRS